MNWQWARRLEQEKKHQSFPHSSATYAFTYSTEWRLPDLNLTSPRPKAHWISLFHCFLPGTNITEKTSLQIVFSTTSIYLACLFLGSNIYMLHILTTFICSLWLLLIKIWMD